MEITDGIYSIGVFDNDIDLFEGQYPVSDGISYNSYIIKDRKIAVLDTVEEGFVGIWLANLEARLDGGTPDYLIVQHMEPDHSAGIIHFLDKYPEAVVIASQAAFRMMRGFFGTEFEGRRRIVTEGDTLSLGVHELTFIAAPMVHWPEVIMTYEKSTGSLFSADAFGRFGKPATGDAWVDEARRYYVGIVGKYGRQVQTVLKKLAPLDVKRICPLHGPVLSENLDFYLDLYNKWSAYLPESRGVTVAYASIYGNTREVALVLARLLKEQGETVVVHDLARVDKYLAVSDAFRFDRLVLAAATYNAGVFPPMRELLTELRERGYKNRRVALIENGSWAPAAAKTMRTILGEEVEYIDPVIRITSRADRETMEGIEHLAKTL
ncbi:MAG: FprA family A-type flavoprotein [Clostridia bacterium]|nr:FprA family A-type flavoprotein [Clostridia bacterium]